MVQGVNEQERRKILPFPLQSRTGILMASLVYEFNCLPESSSLRFESSIFLQLLKIIAFVLAVVTFKPHDMAQALISLSAFCSCLSVKFKFVFARHTAASWGWSGGAMVLGKLPVPGRPTI